MKPRQDKDLHDDGIVDLRGIAILFIDASLGFHTAIPVVILFVLSMLMFFTGLLAFLREAYLPPQPCASVPRLKAASIDRGFCVSFFELLRNRFVALAKTAIQ